MGRFRIAILGLTAALLVTPATAFEFPTLRQPTWQELSPQQKQILAPLGTEWDQMDDARRKKWVGIAARYPHLTLDEQTRIQGQMQEWAKLSPQQRKAVREKYKAMRKAPPEKRSTREQWERYQELPEEEKLRLQKEAKARADAAAQAKKRAAAEKARQPAAVLPPQVAKPGYPIAPVQQAPAPVITVIPTPVIQPPPPLATPVQP